MSNEEKRIELETNLKEAFACLEDYEKVRVWNEYCSQINYCDDMIEYMDTIDDCFCGMSPSEIIQLFSGADFDINHEYWQTDGYGIPVSFNYPEDKIEEDDLIDYMIENETGLENNDLENIIEDYLCDLEDEEEDDDNE